MSNMADGAATVFELRASVRRVADVEGTRVRRCLAVTTTRIVPLVRRSTLERLDELGLPCRPFRGSSLPAIRAAASLIKLISQRQLQMTFLHLPCSALSTSDAGCR